MKLNPQRIKSIEVHPQGIHCRRKEIMYVRDHHVRHPADWFSSNTNCTEDQPSLPSISEYPWKITRRSASLPMQNGLRIFFRSCQQGIVFKFNPIHFVGSVSFLMHWVSAYARRTSKIRFGIGRCPVWCRFHFDPYFPLPASYMHPYAWIIKPREKGKLHCVSFTSCVFVAPKNQKELNNVADCMHEALYQN